MLDSDLYCGLFGFAISPVTISDLDDPKRPIIFANRSFSDLTGYSNSEILDQNYSFLRSRTANPRTVEAMHHAVQARQDSCFVLGHQKKDGRRFYGYLSVSFFVSPSGRNICLGCHFDARIDNYPSYVFDEMECFDGDVRMMMASGTNYNFTALLRAQQMAADAAKMALYVAIREANTLSRLTIAA